MTVILDQFVQSLVESGLIPADEIRAYLNGLPPEEKPTSGEDLAKLLVRRRKLTKFQAQAVYQDKTKALILGDYVLLDRIGQGGMGQVFKARHIRMQRVVALKTLPLAATKCAMAIQRFHREVKLAARLSHANIVTAYDAGESHGLHYLVMEYVESADLASLVGHRGPLPVNEALDYVTQAACGLEYAHREHVIHRDIKPSNLLLDKNGTVKVLDMGLARLTQTIETGGAAVDETLTETGQIMGTIDFLPPEQAQDSKNADERSDIYSLGCTLHFLLSGRAIYDGDTTVMKILAHREADIPSLQAERDDVSRQLDAVYQKMVAKKPEDRYTSMTEVISELERCRAPNGSQLAETEACLRRVDPQPPSRARPISETRDLAADESLELNLPVVSPMDEFRRKHLKPGKFHRLHFIIAFATVAMFLVLLLSVLFMLRTPEGILVVRVSQPNAEIQVDNGKVILKSPNDNIPIEIEVAEGKHNLVVRKSGFQTLTKEFTVRSGGREVFHVTLLPESKAAQTDAVSPPGLARPLQSMDPAAPLPGSDSASGTRLHDATPDVASVEVPVHNAPTPDATPFDSNSSLPAGNDAPPFAMAPFDAGAATEHLKAWADHLGVPVAISNSIGMKLVLIPPGEFLMGSSDEEIARQLRIGNGDKWGFLESEGPQHKVRITKPFYLGRHEVTVGQFRRFARETGYKTEAETDGQGGRIWDHAKNTWHQRSDITWQNTGFEQSDEHPVVQVSWNDCVAFCRWLSGEEGKTYDLPTEAQWEYVCRAGSTTRWCFGDDVTDLGKYAWYERIGGESTKPVGRKLSNDFGLFDVHGNVWEWCFDQYGKQSYSESPVDDPGGPINGSFRSLRGGSWSYSSDSCRSAYRNGLKPDYRFMGLGCRVALIVED